MHLPQCMCELAACKRTAVLFTGFRHNGLRVKPSCYYEVSISVHLVMCDQIQRSTPAMQFTIKARDEHRLKKKTFK